MTTPPDRPAPPEQPAFAPDPEHETIVDLLGVYALGHLDPAERAAVDGHLTRCADCRDELALLAPLVDALDTLPDDAVAASPVEDEGAHPSLEPSDEKLSAILASVRGEHGALSRPPAPRLVSLVATGPLPLGVRSNSSPGAADSSDGRTPLHAPTTVLTPAGQRDLEGDPVTDQHGEATVTALRHRPRRLPTLAVAAAGLVLALAGLGVGLGIASVGGLAGTGSAGETVTVQALDPAVAASADVVAHSWGVEMQLAATGFAPGRAYRVAVLDTTGRTVDAGAFIGTGDTEMLCRLNSSVLRPDATGFVVTDTTGTPVLTSTFT